MRITKKIAEHIELFDDDTEFGGKSYADEMLDNFMGEAGVPFGSSLKTVNKALKECGLETYTCQQIREMLTPFHNQLKGVY